MSQSPLITFHVPSSYVPLEKRTGKLAFTLTNDYLFKIVLPVHHIGILNFSLDGLPKQFYSHYYLTEQHTHAIYTSKFRLSVLDLTQAALANKADRQHHLHLWAAAFRATTWEEFYMIAKEDVLFQKVADALYIVLENRELAEQIRRQWEAEATRKRLEEEHRQRETALETENAALKAKLAQFEAVQTE